MRIAVKMSEQKQLNRLSNREFKFQLLIKIKIVFVLCTFIPVLNKGLSILKQEGHYLKPPQLFFIDSQYTFHIQNVR